jgi:hypothetical protein
MPELFIPQAECRYTQRTALDVAADSIALTRTLRAIHTLLADILPPRRASSDGSPISSPTEPATETAARK